jgi:enolase
MQMGSEVYMHLKQIIKEQYGAEATGVGDERGFAPNVATEKEVFELVKKAIEKAGYTDDIKIGLDVAASEFYNDENKTYDLNFKDKGGDPKKGGGPKLHSSDELLAVYKGHLNAYPIASIEDPFDQVRLCSTPG